MGYLARDNKKASESLAFVKLIFNQMANRIKSLLGLIASGVDGHVLSLGGFQHQQSHDAVCGRGFVFFVVDGDHRVEACASSTSLTAARACKPRRFGSVLYA